MSDTPSLAAAARPGPAGVRRCSLRLPLAVAARLEAWCEMHPQRSRSEWMATLLESGLTEAERSLAVAHRGPGERGKRGPDPAGEVMERAPREEGEGGGPIPGAQPSVYLPSGPFAEFHGLVNKHHLQLEQARDAASRGAPAAPEAPFPAVEYLLAEE